MKLFGLLLKKEFVGLRPRRRNLLGSAVGAVTVLLVMAAFVYLFIALHQRFIPLGISGEILTLFTCAVFVLSLALSFGKADKILYSAEDREIVRPLPLGACTVIWSKAAALFLYELAAVGAVSLPLYIAFGITSGAGAVFYCKMLLCVFTVTLAVTAFALILSPLYDRVKNFLLNHGLLLFVLSLLFIGLLFFGYKYLLDLIIGLIRDRRLQFVFNTGTVEGIRAAAGYLLFSSSLTHFLEGTNGRAVFLSLGVAAVLFLCGFLLAVHIYRSPEKTYAPRARKTKNRVRSVTGALFFKEVNELVRTPGYMFSYLSIVLSLPALTYLTMSVLQEVVAQMLTATFVGPFTLLVVVLYATVSNTFAGDAVSREGNKLSIVKTVPVSYKLQIGIKLLLALGIAGVAIAASVGALLWTGTLGWLDALFILLTALLSAFGSVIAMLNNDLGGMDAERNTSRAVVLSFLYSLLLGAAAVGLAFVLREAYDPVLVYVVPLIISALYCGIVAIRYFKTMERKIKLL